MRFKLHYDCLLWGMQLVSLSEATAPLGLRTLVLCLPFIISIARIAGHKQFLCHWRHQFVFEKSVLHWRLVTQYVQEPLNVSSLQQQHTPTSKHMKVMQKMSLLICLGLKWMHAWPSTTHMLSDVRQCSPSLLTKNRCCQSKEHCKDIQNLAGCGRFTLMPSFNPPS